MKNKYLSHISGVCTSIVACKLWVISREYLHFGSAYISIILGALIAFSFKLNAEEVDAKLTISSISCMGTAFFIGEILIPGPNSNYIYFYTIEGALANIYILHFYRGWPFAKLNDDLINDELDEIYLKNQSKAPEPKIPLFTSNGKVLFFKHNQAKTLLKIQLDSFEYYLAPGTTFSIVSTELDRISYSTKYYDNTLKVTFPEDDELVTYHFDDSMIDENTILENRNKYQSRFTQIDQSHPLTHHTKGSYPLQTFHHK